MLGNFSNADFFSILIFFNKFFQEQYQSVKPFVFKSGQDRCSVGPDLGKVISRLQVTASKERFRLLSIPHQ